MNPIEFPGENVLKESPNEIVLQHTYIHGIAPTQITQSVSQQPQYNDIQTFFNIPSPSTSSISPYSLSPPGWSITPIYSPGYVTSTQPQQLQPMYLPQNLLNSDIDNQIMHNPVSDIPHHVQTNGRKVFSLQPNWVGPPPSNRCELFIKKIPRNMSEYVLIPHFQRFGPLFEFRLMLDFNECNRGYGFIKFCLEEDACRAILVMNHFFIKIGKSLEIHRSYDKCRLFVANIPKEKSEEELDKEFRAIFPSLEKIIMHKRICDRFSNRGFVFLDFPNHEEALTVKKQTTPGRLRKWDRDLKIVWAKEEPDVDPDVMEKVTTLFVRNIDLSVNTRDIYSILTTQVKRSDIRKVSRNRELAFIEFVTKEAAETVLSKLNGAQLKGYNLEMQWATPQNLTIDDVMKHKNFDEILRLKCIANYWSVPIFIYGRIFNHINVQYIAVMIRENNIPHVFFIEMDLINLKDIHRRTCEVIVRLIEHVGQLPALNFIIKIKQNSAFLIGCITNLATVNYRKASHVNEDMLIYSNEIYELSQICYQLSQNTENQIISIYNSSFLQCGLALFNGLGIQTNERILSCIIPNTNKPLKYRLNNTQIIFSLINITTFSNYLFPVNSSHAKVLNFTDNECSENRFSQLKMIILKLLSLDLIETNKNESFKCIAFSPTECSLSTPIWIGATPYCKKIYDI